jgi:excisionase family DNA binding protein
VSELEQKLLTVPETAKFLGVSKSWVYQASNRGELPAYRVGRSLRFDLATLRAWLMKTKTTPPAVATLGRG